MTRRSHVQYLQPGAMYLYSPNCNVPITVSFDREEGSFYVMIRDVYRPLDVSLGVTSGRSRKLLLVSYIHTALIIEARDAAAGMLWQSTLPLAALALVVAAILLAPAGASRCLTARPQPAALAPSRELVLSRSAHYVCS